MGSFKTYFECRMHLCEVSCCRCIVFEYVAVVIALLSANIECGRLV